jgi:hypothetical protein
MSETGCMYAKLWLKSGFTADIEQDPSEPNALSVVNKSSVREYQLTISF